MAYHALTLSKEVTGWLEAGVCDVPLDNVEGAARCEPGQPVRLLSPAGSLCAIGIADPENELVRVMALEREGFSSIDARLLRARIQRALDLRAGFGLAREKTTHRLIHGAGDGLSGLGVDVYGEFAVAYAYSRGLMSIGRTVAQLLLEELGLAG